MLYIKGFLIVYEPYSYIKKHQKQLLVNRKLEAHFYLIFILLFLSHVFFLFPPVQIYEKYLEKEVGSQIDFITLLVKIILAVV